MQLRHLVINQSKNLVIILTDHAWVEKSIHRIEASLHHDRFEYYLQLKPTFNLASGDIASRIVSMEEPVRDYPDAQLMDYLKRQQGNFIEIFVLDEDPFLSGHPRLADHLNQYWPNRVTRIFADMTCSPSYLMDSYLPLRIPLIEYLSLFSDHPSPTVLETLFYTETDLPDHFSVEPDWQHLNILLEITRRCNFACPHCARTLEMKASAESVTPEVLETFIRSEALTLITLIGAGEPLLHPQMPAISDVLHERGLPVNLLTNGTLLTHQRLHSLRHCDLTTVVSLDGANEQQFSESRKAGVFEKIKANLLEYHRKLPHSPIHVNMVVSAKNYRHIDDVLNLCRQFGASHLFIVNLLAFTKDTADMLPFRLAPEVRYKLMVQAIGKSRQLGIRFSGKPLFPTKRACTRPWSQPFITATGDVYPCSFGYMHPHDILNGQKVLFPGKAYCLGNLKESGLEPLLQGNKIKRIREVLLEDQGREVWSWQMFNAYRKSFDLEKNPYNYCRICLLRWNCAC